MAGGRLGEFELIARHFAPMAGEGALGLLDDAALLSLPAGQDLVLTKDLLVADVHFFAGDAPDLVARKALRVNLSDLAAKAATPAGFLLGLALPQDWRADWLDNFASGLAADVAHFACPLLGGDTTRTPGALTISVTAIGYVPAGAMPHRNAARAGDRIYVTGTIGDGALGLLAHPAAPDSRLTSLSPAARQALLARYLLPQPRLALAAALRAHARAAMDVSDGFVGDLGKMLAGAGCGGEIALERVPLSPEARAAIAHSPDLFDIAVTGGDDYELIVVVPPAKAAAFEAAAGEAGIAVALVGEATAGPSICFIDRKGRPRQFDRASFDHFRPT